MQWFPFDYLWVKGKENFRNKGLRGGVDGLGGM